MGAGNKERKTQRILGSRCADASFGERPGLLRLPADAGHASIDCLISPSVQQEQP